MESCTLNKRDIAIPLIFLCFLAGKSRFHLLQVSCLVMSMLYSSKGSWTATILCSFTEGCQHFGGPTFHRPLSTQYTTSTTITDLKALIHFCNNDFSVKCYESISLFGYILIHINTCLPISQFFFLSF